MPMKAIEWSEFSFNNDLFFFHPHYTGRVGLFATITKPITDQHYSFKMSSFKMVQTGLMTFFFPHGV